MNDRVPIIFTTSNGQKFTFIVSQKHADDIFDRWVKLKHGTPAQLNPIVRNECWDNILWAVDLRNIEVVHTAVLRQPTSPSVTDPRVWYRS